MQNSKIFLIIDEGCVRNIKYVNIQIGLWKTPQKIFLVNDKEVTKSDSINISELILITLEEYEIDPINFIHFRCYCVYVKNCKDFQI